MPRSSSKPTTCTESRPTTMGKIDNIYANAASIYASLPTINTTVIAASLNTLASSELLKSIPTPSALIASVNTTAIVEAASAPEQPMFVVLLLSWAVAFFGALMLLKRSTTTPAAEKEFDIPELDETPTEAESMRSSFSSDIFAPDSPPVKALMKMASDVNLNALKVMGCAPLQCIMDD